MEVEYSLELEDLLAFNQYRNAHSPTFRRQQFTSRVGVLVALLGVWVLLFGMVGTILAPRTWIACGLFIALVAAVFFFSFPALVRRRTRRLVGRMYMEGQNRGLFARRRLTITPETITDATEISVTTMKWVAVEKIAVDQRHVFFYVTATSAFILPKAALATEEEFEEFVETAGRYHRDAGG